MGTFLSLTYWVDSQKRNSPITSRVVLVRNDADTTLSPAYSEEFIRRVVASDQLTVVEIPASEGLPHDLVAFQPESAAYPKLTEAYAHLSTALGIPLADPRAR